jgi:hypothetical protein
MLAHQRLATLGEQAVELVGLQPQLPTAPETGRDAAADLVDQRLQPVAEVVALQGGG